jgi:hypothetical protein
MFGPIIHGKVKNVATDKTSDKPSHIPLHKPLRDHRMIPPPSDNTCIPEKYQKIIRDGARTLTPANIINMHGYRTKHPQLQEFYNTVSSLPRLEYRPGMPFKSAIHIGQLKLLHSEWRFLLEYLYQMWTNGELTESGEQYGECNKKIVVIAPGGAAGYHFTQLAQLLPLLYFDLIDPNPFDKELKKYPQIETHQSLFTDELAHEYNKKYDGWIKIIVSDIRSANADKMSRDEVEERVLFDMNLQDNWFRIINPDFCIYKFRTPYFSTTPIDKLRVYNGIYGKLYLQTVPGATSSELRLVALKNAPEHVYDSQEIEEQCFAHNSIHRGNLYIHGYEGLCGLDSCYDCAAIVECVALHIKMLREGFPHISDKWTNIESIISWLLPKHIHKIKIVKFNNLTVSTTFARPYNLYYIDPVRRINFDEPQYSCEQPMNVFKYVDLAKEQ